MNRYRQDFSVLNRRIGGRPVVYFDNACMSLRPDPVVDAIGRYYHEHPGCHGRTDHHFGRATTRAYDRARKLVRKYIGARGEEECIFVRNATEGINLVAGILPLGEGDAILCSDIEHNSNLLPWQGLRLRRGVEHRIFTTNDDTSFSMDAFMEALDGRVKLVSVVHTSNLSGTTFPVADIIREAHRKGALVLVDAAQSVLCEDVDVRGWDADFLVFSGHKTLGPTGTGVLYGKAELLRRLPCHLLGGETITDTTYSDFTLADIPDKYEAGLQNYAGVIGLGAAVEYVMKVGRKRIRQQVAALNQAATEGLLRLDGVRIIGPENSRARTGILNFMVAGMKAEDISRLLNENANIMVRLGKHCVHSWYNARKLPHSVRASFSFYNSLAEAELFARTMQDLVRFFKLG